MKNYIMAFFMVCNIMLIKAQITEGTINYTTILIDTVNNTTTNLPDSIRHTYYFKNNSCSWFIGTDSVNNSLVVNNQGTYMLNKVYSNKFYSFLEAPANFKLDTLNNYTDSSTVRYLFTSEHEAIMGYYCTKAYMYSLDETTGDTVQVTTIWYTTQIKGYNFIPAAAAPTLNLNGLILQYEYPIENGTAIVTPISISSNSVSNDVFNPVLTGYVNMDSNNTN